MALEPRRIFLDVQSRQFVSSPISSLPSADPTWVDEDVEALQIYALRPTNDPAIPFAFVDLSGATVKFAVGSTTPAALQTSWTSLSTAVTAAITELQVGGGFGGTVDEIQRITWSGATAVRGSYAIKFPERTITSASVLGKFVTANNHGLYNGQTVRLDTANGTLGFVTSRSYSVINASQGSFQLAEIGTTTAAGTDAASATVNVVTSEIVTPSISYSASMAQVQQAIVDAGFVDNGIPQVIASGENAQEVTLYYAGRNGQGAYPNVVIVNSSLAGAPGVAANVSYNTDEIAALIAAGTTNVTMEVEISEGAARQTFRQPATLSADLISSTSPSPLPANVSTTFSLQSANGSVFTFTVTNDGELMIAPVP
jgi:hypothetical protein